jgi:hypothetical protein
VNEGLDGGVMIGGGRGCVREMCEENVYRSLWMITIKNWTAVQAKEEGTFVRESQGDLSNQIGTHKAKISSFNGWTH